MPDWLIDPSSSTYLLLAAAAAGAAFYWFRTQTRKSALIAGAVLALVAAWVGLAVAVESPREEAVRRIEAMVAAANRFDPAGVLPQISESFRYNAETKKSFGSAETWNLARRHEVVLAVWDFDRDAVERPDPNTLVLGFMLKADGQHEGRPFNAWVYAKAPFGRDPDGAWRLRSFTLYRDPLQKSRGDVFVVPGTH
jgi:hypothetical protein